MLNKNVLNILRCIGNTNINIQWKSYVSTIIFFEVAPKNQYQFCQTDFM